MILVAIACCVVDLVELARAKDVTLRLSFALTGSSYCEQDHYRLRLVSTTLQPHSFLSFVRRPRLSSLALQTALA